MSVTLRIVQTFDASNEKEFIILESAFAELEHRRKDFPKGRRFRPVATAETNKLIWECEFANVADAQAALTLFAQDPEHEKLAVKQRPYFKDVKVEFFEPY